MAASTSPAHHALALTPNDDTDLSNGATRGIYVGVSGDIVAILCPGTTAVTFKSVPVGVLPIEASRVKATGTTATNLLALY